MPTFVPAPPTDDTTELLAPFLALAASWSLDTPQLSAADVLTDRTLSRYVRDWGRPGDLAVLAYREDGETATGSAEGSAGSVEGDGAADWPAKGPIGAAWLRRFSADDPGFGFVSATIPELVVAVDPAHQGEGVGTQLVQAVLGMARLEDVGAVSVSVAQANGAIVLYSHLGFEEIGVAEGTSIMLKRLA